MFDLGVGKTSPRGILGGHPIRFILIHGAYHGSWCWELLRPELERRGHEVITPDLPCEDPAAGADRYASAVVDAVPSPGEPAVVVGHSLGGLTLPVVALRTPTRLMVFLAALMPAPGLSFDAQQPAMDSGFRPSETPIANPDGSATWPEQGAIEMYYHDCDPEVARSAARQLRPQQWLITQETTPITTWPDLPSASVIARDDRAIRPAYLRELARNRLQVEPIEIDGGHSPFLARPPELAEMLDMVAAGEVTAAS